MTLIGRSTLILFSGLAHATRFVNHSDDHIGTSSKPVFPAPRLSLSYETTTSGGGAGKGSTSTDPASVRFERQN